MNICKARLRSPWLPQHDWGLGGDKELRIPLCHWQSEGTNKNRHILWAGTRCGAILSQKPSSSQLPAERESAMLRAFSAIATDLPSCLGSLLQLILNTPFRGGGGGLPLFLCFSKYSPWTSNIGITWNLLEKPNPRPHPSPMELEAAG